MKDTVSHYVPPHSPLTSTEPQVFSNNLTMPCWAPESNHFECIVDLLARLERAKPAKGCEGIVHPHLVGWREYCTTPSWPSLMQPHERISGEVVAQSAGTGGR